MDFVKTTTRTAVMTLQDGEVPELEIQSAGCSRMPLNDENRKALVEMLAHRF